MMQNPILSGFHADPCICRRGGDYFIAVSSFEWYPGIPVYHSRDLKNWELHTHILTAESQFQLIGLPSGCGVWAPCLTWCEQDGLFYLVYGVMNAMDGGYFDIDNFVITAPDIRGPWSEPVYLHSAGFDASLFHDEDNRKWLTSLEWETREGYEQPGAICLVEYSPERKKYQLNAYRVLLTRARQGMVLCVPEGNSEDSTRLPEFYDGTYKYFRQIGIPELGDEKT